MMSPASRVRLIRLSRLYRRIISSRIHPGATVEYPPLSDRRLIAHSARAETQKAGYALAKDADRAIGGTARTASSVHAVLSKLGHGYGDLIAPRKTRLPSSILPAFLSRSLGRFSIAPTGPLKLKAPST